MVDREALVEAIVREDPQRSDPEVGGDRFRRYLHGRPTCALARMARLMVSEDLAALALTDHVLTEDGECQLKACEGHSC